jgi:integrase
MSLPFYRGWLILIAAVQGGRRQTPKSPKKKRSSKRILALPDLERSKAAVLNSLTSKSGQRSYDHAITDFVEWYCSEPRLAFNRTVVLRYRIYLEQKHYAPTTINLRLAAAESDSLRGKRNYAILAMLIGCGLRRGELLALRVDAIQLREEHWVIADLLGKAGHIRTIPIPGWVKAAVDAWKVASGITEGTLFRSINKAGKVWGRGMTPKVLWEVVREGASHAGIEKLAPHDLRRTCARLCHLAGGELDQIQFLLGHVSIQTTERYLGCKQKLRDAVNDRMGIEPEADR